MGYLDNEIEAIVAYIDANRSVIGAPHLRPEHLAVFACSMGDNVIDADGHISMMAACQPFLSGAISKTVNLPETVSVEDVEQLLIRSWRLGLKAVAIYRDNCKVGQHQTSTHRRVLRSSPLISRPPLRPRLLRRSASQNGSGCRGRDLRKRSSFAWRIAKASQRLGSTTTVGLASSLCGSLSRARRWRASWMLLLSRSVTGCSTACHCRPTSGHSWVCALSQQA